MPTHSDEAICIRQWDWSETSQTVSLLSSRLGIVRGIAKGSKRPKSSFSGGIEPLTRGEFSAIIKSGEGLSTITAWDLVETFPWLRSSLSAHHAGLYMADLVQHFLRDHDPHPAAYEALLEGLRGLRNDGMIQEQLLRFQWGLLIETGFRPALESEDPGVVQGFDPEAGVFRPDPGPGRHASVWRVRPETIEALLAVERGERPHAGPGLERANRLLATYAAWVLGRTPPSAEAVFGRLLPTSRGR